MTLQCTQKGVLCAKKFTSENFHLDNEYHHTNGQAKHRQAQGVNINSKVMESMNVILQGQKGSCLSRNQAPESPT